MTKRIMLILICGLASVTARAQELPPVVAPLASDDAMAATALAPVPALVRVAIKTGLGDIVLALEKERAPLTTANFLRYVDQKRLDGTHFYRAMKIGTDGAYGLIQGGVLSNPKRVLPPVAHETTTKTGLSHVDGTVSMARLAPGTAAGDFFITIGALTALDAQPGQPGDNQGFAAFGRVVEGMDVVKRIQFAPISDTEGKGVMKGQIIAAPVPIISVRRLP